MGKAAFKHFLLYLLLLILLFPAKRTLAQEWLQNCDDEGYYIFVEPNIWRAARFSIPVGAGAVKISQVSVMLLYDANDTEHPLDPNTRVRFSVWNNSTTNFPDSRARIEGIYSNDFSIETWISDGEYWYTVSFESSKLFTGDFWVGYCIYNDGTTEDDVQPYIMSDESLANYQHNAFAAYSNDGENWSYQDNQEIATDFNIKVEVVWMNMPSKGFDYYDWPLVDMQEQHRIVGVINEFRGFDRRIHDGVDITDESGLQYCYNIKNQGVVDYTASTDDNFGLKMPLNGNEYMWYIHLENDGTQPLVDEGTTVNIGDYLGATNSLNHVHLSEGENKHETSPIHASDNTGLKPWDDVIQPTINSIYVALENDDNEAEEGELASSPYRGGETYKVLAREKYDIIVDCYDHIFNNEDDDRPGVRKIKYRILRESLQPGKSPITGSWIHSWADGGYDWLGPPNQNDPKYAQYMYANGSELVNDGPSILKYIITNTTANSDAGTLDITDTTLFKKGTLFTIEVRVYDFNGIERIDYKTYWVEEYSATYLVEEENIPDDYNITQNYPNPFNPNTEIIYQLPKEGKLKIEIYNVIGQKIKTLVDKFEIAGKHSVNWDATNDENIKVASGTYFYRMQVNDFIETKKLLLVR